MPQKPKYTFLVGAFEPRRKCSVRALSLEAAYIKATAEMDRRHERANSEPPVGYDFELIAINDERID